MLKCGEYTLDRKIGWGRSATYYSAYAGDEAGTQRLVIRYSRHTERSHVRAFLQSAAEQQTAISSGCRRVAPVLDFGVADNGHAYHVSLGYETSLAECIQAGNAVDHDRLRFIVTSILKALAELRDKFKRPHGNLTAGNILLDQNGEVILTDLAPLSGDLRYFTDLQALGEIIYQLVRQSLRIGFLSPPLERSPEWSKSLGDHADDWREFTNRMLLTKRGEGQEGLKRAIADLKALNTLAEKAAAEPAIPSAVSYSQQSGSSTTGRAPTPKRKSRAGLVAAIVVLAAGIGGGAFWHLQHTAQKKKEEEISIVPPPPSPREIVQKLPDSTAYAAADNYLKRTKSTATTYSQIGQYLYDWPVPGKLADLAKVWNAPGRDWQELAEALKTDAYDEMVQMQSQAPDPDVLMKVAGDVSRMSSALSEAEALEKAWGRLEKLLQTIGERKIAALPDFKVWASWRIKSSADLKTANQAAKDADTALDRFNAVARANEARIHIEAWKKAIANLTNYQDPKVAGEWPQLWENAIASSLKVDDTIQQGWTTSLAAIGPLINRRPPQERPGLQTKVTELKARISLALASDEKEIAAISDAIAALKKSIRHPLEDMDAAYRTLFAQFEAQLPAAGSTADGSRLLQSFAAAVDGLRKNAEYRSFDAEFIKQNDVDDLLGRMRAAVAKPDEPQFTFGNTRWVKGTVSDTRGTFSWNNRPMTFHILKGKNVAIGSMEVPLSMARSTGIPLDRPGTNGPLAYRDDHSGGARWLWPIAERWYTSATRRFESGDTGDLLAPGTLLSAPDPEECPVTWISATNARAIAQAFGARLPTRDEWKSALETFRPATARLKGPTAARVEREISKYQFVRNPVTRFVPVVPTLNFGGTPPFAVTVVDENTMWLRAVRDNPAGISDLIGNASEWVADDGGNFVVGGSFATPPTVNFTDPKPIGTGEGNCDVTLRLAVPVMEGQKNSGLTALRDVATAENQRLRATAPLQM